jgi:hypothetical protein
VFRSLNLQPCDLYHELGFSPVIIFPTILGTQSHKNVALTRSKKG